jgi:hypothetical protein
MLAITHQRTKNFVGIFIEDESIPQAAAGVALTV